MFNKIPQPPADKILAQMKIYKDDTRDNKLDLGVGVYKNEAGEIVIFDSVKQAEKLLYDQQTTKTYVGMAGDVGFNEAMKQIIFGESHSEAHRIKGMQATGGSGSLYVLARLISRFNKRATVWLSDPTWPNHNALLNAGHMKMKTYPYFDPESRTVRFDEMANQLRKLGPKDIVVLHACCHNPTGANLTNKLWDEVAEIAAETGFIPFFDMAYQGFGDGLEEDAYSVRKMASSVPEMVVAASCSKNFGIYRERTGCAFVMGENAEAADSAYAQLLTTSRGVYSMPPDHGASIVRVIWEDMTLRKQWQNEVKEINRRLLLLRQQLADALKEKSDSDRFDFIAKHRGMFSMLGTTTEQALKMRKEHAIFVIDDGRFNVAGLQQDKIERFANAIIAVGC